MKVLSWLGLMLCIVTLAFLALTLAAASEIASVKVIVSEADKSLVDGAMQKLLEKHPMVSSRDGGEPEVHLKVERSPEGCTITDSVVVFIPIQQRVEHLLFGGPSLEHLTPTWVGQALKEHWSQPDRVCLFSADRGPDGERSDPMNEEEIAEAACDSCWAWSGLTSRHEAQVLQDFLNRQGWALSDSAAFSWVIQKDTLSPEKESGTREEGPPFILYRPL